MILGDRKLKVVKTKDVEFGHIMNSNMVNSLSRLHQKLVEDEQDWIKGFKEESYKLYDEDTDRFNVEFKDKPTFEDDFMMGYNEFRDDLELFGELIEEIKGVKYEEYEK